MSLILINERQSDFAALQNILESEKYSFRVVSSVSDLEKYLKDVSYEIIFIGINLSHSDPHELCKLIKENPIHWGTPVFFISEDYSSINKELVFRSGAAGFIVAPFVREEITALLPNQTESGREKKNTGPMTTEDIPTSSILDSLPIPVFYKDTEGKYLGFNSSFEKFFGSKREDLIGKSAYDISPVELAEIYHSKDMELLRDGGEQEYESRVLNADGDTYNALFKKSIFFNRKGESAGIVGTVQDITRRKKAEDELQSNIHLLKTLNKVDEIIRNGTDAEEIMGKVMKALLKIFNCDRAWLLYPCDPEADFWEVPIEEAVPEFPGALEKKVKMPMTEDVAEGMKDLLGSPEPIYGTAPAGEGDDYDPENKLIIRAYLIQAIYPKFGKPWEFGLHQCSHERQWTNEEIKIFKEVAGRIEDALSTLLIFRELRESEQKFHAIFDQTFQFIGLMNTDGRLLEANETSLEFGGIEESDVIGKFFWDTPWWEHSPEMQEKLRLAVEQAASGEFVRFEATHEDADGNTHYIDFSIKPVKDENGNVTVLIPEGRDITDIKMAEEALVEKDYMLESASSAVASADLDGNMNYVNPAFLKLWGFKTEEKIYGRPFPDFWMIEERFDEVMDALWKEGKWIDEIRAIRKDGTLFDVQVSASMVRDKEGNPVSLMASSIDITDRRKTEEALRISEESKRRVLDNATELITRHDLEGNFVYANRAAEEIIGITLDELKGMNFAPFIHPEDLEEAAQNHEILISGSPNESTFRIFGREGRVIYIETQGIPYYENGEIAGTTVFSRDVTDRVLAEKKLRQSEKKYRSVLENSIEMINQYDAEGNVLYMNRAGEEITGYTLDEVKGTSFVPYIHPEDLDQVMGDHLKIMSGEPREGTFRIFRKDGRVIYLESQSIPYYEGGELKHSFTFARDVTDRVTAEKELSEAKALLESVIMNSPIPMSLVSAKDNRVLMFNSAGRELFNLDDTVDYTGKNLFELDLEVDHFYPDGSPAPLEEWPIVKAIKGSEMHNVEMIVERQDGSRRWEIVSAIPISNSEGENIAGLVVFPDITDLKKAEEALRESEEKYRDIFNSFLDIYIETTLDGKILEISPSIERYGGSKREELIGKSAIDFYVDPERRTEMLQELLKKDYIHDFDIDMVDKEGQIIPVSLTSRIVRDSEGNPVKTIGVGRDITDRKKVEESLRKSEEKLKTIFKYSPVGMALYDLNHRYVLINDSMASIHGKTVEEHIGRSVEEILPEDGSKVTELFNQIIETGEAVYNLEISGIVGSRPDRDSHFIISYFPVKDSEDKVILLGSVVVDVTEQKEAVDEKNRLQEQLLQAQKLESVGRLAGGVAHDFNNMLNVIIGQVEMALFNMPEDDPLRRRLDEIDKAAHRSADLTRQLLAFARHQTVEPKILNLNDTIESMLKMVGRLIGEDIELVWKPCEEPSFINIDPAQVDQLMANLTVNARDAIEGVGTISIETGIREFDQEYCNNNPGYFPGKYVSISVSDDGKGMDPETKEFIFEPFFTTKGVGKGSGLGLATVYGIVKQNSGFINVYSEPGQGSTFRIYLPSSEEVAEAGDDYGDVIPDIMKGHETVLFVEDESSILEVGKEILENLGYNVLAASKPGEAVRIAENYKGDIQILISDVVMPEMNGRDLSLNILSLYPKIKTLYISGYTSNIIEHRGVLDEGVKFLQKPFTKKELSEKVREVLDS